MSGLREGYKKPYHQQAGCIISLALMAQPNQHTINGWGLQKPLLAVHGLSVLELHRIHHKLKGRMGG